MHPITTARIAFTVITLILSLTASTFADRTAGAPAPPAGWTDGYVIANNIRIHYWRTGGADKPKLIMLHGSSDNGLCFTNFAKQLTDQYDIILPDARGHGLSDPNSKTDPANSQAEDIMGIINALDLKNPIVMGHSMGSASAAWFAATYPDVPRAVILEDPRLVPRPASSNSDPAAIEKEQERKRQSILSKNNSTWQKLVDEQMARNDQWGRSEIEIWATSKLQHHPNTAYRNLGARPAMSDLFKKITAPTLILKADDQGELRETNFQVTKILKHGQIVHIKDAKHNVRRDQKQRTLKTLKKFLAEL